MKTFKKIGMYNVIQREDTLIISKDGITNYCIAPYYADLHIDIGFTYRVGEARQRYTIYTLLNGEDTKNLIMSIQKTLGVVLSKQVIEEIEMMHFNRRMAR